MMLYTQAYADSVCHMGVRNWKNQLHYLRNCSCCIYPNVCGQCIINNSSGVQSSPCIFIPLFIDWCQNGACAIHWNEANPSFFILLIFWRENCLLVDVGMVLELKRSHPQLFFCWYFEEKVDCLLFIGWCHIKKRHIWKKVTFEQQNRNPNLVFSISNWISLGTGHIYVQCTFCTLLKCNYIRKYFKLKT